VVKNRPSQDDAICPSNEETPSLHILPEPVCPSHKSLFTQKMLPSGNSNAPRHLGASPILETSAPRMATTTTCHPWSAPTVTQPDLPPRS